MNSLIVLIDSTFAPVVTTTSTNSKPAWMAARRSPARSRVAYVAPPVVIVPPPLARPITVLTTRVLAASRRTGPVRGWLGGSSSPSGYYQGTVVSSGPAGYWKLDDTTATAADASGNGRPGTYSGTYTQSNGSLVPADAGGSVTFTAGGIDVTGYQPSTSPPFTVEAWVSASSAASSSEGKRFASRGIQATGGWAAGIFNGFGLTFTTYTHSNGSFSYTLTPNVNYHLVFVYKADLSVDLYVNGVFQQNVAGVGPVSASTADFYIGRAAPGGLNEFWTGAIDEVSYYQRQLTAAEILAHYQAATQIAGTLIRCNLGPFPPILTLTTTPVTKIGVNYRSLSQRTARVARARTAYVSPPVVVVPPPLVRPVEVVPAAFSGRRRRGAPFRSSLNPPVVLQTFGGPVVSATKARPRHVRSFLPAPTVAATGQVFTGPAVTLAHGRRRYVRSSLFPPTVLQVFPGPGVYVLPLDRPSRFHRRAAISVLFPPIIPPAAFVAAPVVVVLTKGRPRWRLPLPDQLPAVTFRVGDTVTVTNAILNGSFDSNTTGWSSSGSQPNFGRYTTPTLYGSGALGADQNSGSAFVQTTAGHGAILPNQPYILSMWINVSGAGPFVPLCTTFQGDNTTQIAVHTGPTFSPVAGVWTRVSVSFTSESNAGFAAAQLRDNNGTSRTYIDGVQLEIGSNANPVVITNGSAATQTFQYVNGGMYRVLGPWPPTLIGPLPTPAQTTVTVTGTASKNRLSPRRNPFSRVFPPTVLSTFGGPAVSKARIRPRHTASFLYPPILATAPTQVFTGPAVALARVRRRHVQTVLFPPTALQVFPGPVESEVAVRIPVDDRRRRGVRSFAIQPVVLPQTSTIDVRLVRTRPPRTHSFLTSVFYPSSSEIAVVLQRVRPRKTRWFLTDTVYPQATPVVEAAVAVKTVVDDRRRRAARSVLSPPEFYPSTSVISVRLARTRPRKTHWSLTATTYPASSAISAKLVQSRPRRVHSFLFVPPRVVAQTFAGPSVFEAKNRPRRTHSFLTAVTYPATSVVSTRLVRTRPRHTRSFLTAISYPQTGRVAVALVRNRPRRTRWFLTSVSYPQTGEITVALARSRPRRTHSFLTAVSYPASSSIQTKLARTRPRLTRWFLTDATYPQVTRIAEAEIAVRTLAVVRPRRTHSFLSNVVYPATSAITVRLVRTRPRRTNGFVAPPLLILAPPSQRVETVAVYLVAQRLRPRHVLSRLGPPVFYAATSVISTALAVTRPRRTHSFLAAPTALQTFSGPSVAQTRIRPRHTRSFLSPPTVVTTPSTLLAQETIRVTLDRTRPRRTIVRRVTPVVSPATSTIVVKLVHVRPRPTRHFAVAPVSYPQTSAIRVVLQRVRPRKTHAFLTNVSYPATSAIETRLVRVRPRATTHFLTNVEYAAAGRITVALTKTRPRPTRHFLTDVTYPAVSAIRVTLARIRPRAVRSSLASPVFYAATSRIGVYLARTRPRPVRARVEPPATLRTFGPPVEVEIAVSTPVERRRLRTRSKLAPPVFYPAVGEIRVVLTTRPRVATRSRLAPPTALQTFAGPKVALAPAARRRVRSFLGNPTTLRTFVGPAVRLAPHTRRRVFSILGHPTATATSAVFTGPLVRLAQTVRRRVHSVLGRPTVAAVAATGVLRVTLARHVRRHARSVLFPPAVVRPVTPPTPEQQTILVKHAPARPRFLPFGGLQPVPVERGIVFTTGYTVPAGKGSGETLAAESAEGYDVAADQATGSPVEGAAADGTTVPAGKASGETTGGSAGEAATSATSAAESTTVSASTAEGHDEAASAAESETVAVNGATISDSPASAGESSDKRAGT